MQEQTQEILWRLLMKFHLNINGLLEYSYDNWNKPFHGNGFALYEK